jgi:hypothetical protein
MRPVPQTHDVRPPDRRPILTLLSGLERLLSLPVSMMSQCWETRARDQITDAFLNPCVVERIIQIMWSLSLRIMENHSLNTVGRPAGIPAYEGRPHT